MQYLFLFIIIFSSVNAEAKGVYQSNTDFLNEVFQNSIPKTQSLWLLNNIKKGAEEILGERPGQLRIRYWKQDQQTAWILEELGKEKLITVGFLIKDKKLQTIKILAFRESRGWEVKEDFFLEQFFQTQITSELKLDRNIDGISGATLSVRALKKLARLALFYHQQVIEKNTI